MVVIEEKKSIEVVCSKGPSTTKNQECTYNNHCQG